MIGRGPMAAALAQSARNRAADASMYDRDQLADKLLTHAQKAEHAALIGEPLITESHLSYADLAAHYWHQLDMLTGIEGARIRARYAGGILSLEPLGPAETEVTATTEFDR